MLRVGRGIFSKIIYLSINLFFIGSLTIKDTLRCKRIEHLCELFFSDVQ